MIQTPMHTPESYNALGDRPPRRVGQVSNVVDGILFPGVIAYITGEIPRH